MGENASHYMPFLIGSVTHLKIYIYPDGGISRIRCDGRSIESAGINVPRTPEVLEQRIKELRDQQRSAVQEEDFKKAIELKRKIEVLDEQLKHRISKTQSRL